jgi:hypothetical protein
MYFLALSSLFLLFPALTLSTPFLDLPTAQKVKQSIINIHHAVLELDATVQAFTGGSFETTLVEGTEVLADVGKIHIENRESFQRALAALPFNVKDAVDVIDTVVSTGVHQSLEFQEKMTTNSIRSKHQHSALNSTSSRERSGVQGRWFVGCSDCQSGASGVRP